MLQSSKGEIGNSVVTYTGIDSAPLNFLPSKGQRAERRDIDSAMSRHASL